MKDFFKLLTMSISLILFIVFVRLLFSGNYNIQIIRNIFMVFLISVIGTIGTTLKEK